MRPELLASLLLSLAPLAPAAARPAPPAAAPAPSAPAPALDPARLAAAERLVALVAPPEVMQRMLGLPLAGMDGVLDMTPEQLGLGPELGFSDADRRRPVRELVSARDPHFRERLEIRSRVMAEVFNEIMVSARPEFTRAMVEFYAGNLTLDEINATAAFYATPAGRHFAAVAVDIMDDPSFVRLMTGLAPRFTRAMTTIEDRVRAASAHLPPDPRPAAGAERSEE